MTSCLLAFSGFGQGDFILGSAKARLHSSYPASGLGHYIFPFSFLSINLSVDGTQRIEYSTNKTCVRTLCPVLSRTHPPPVVS